MKGTADVTVSFAFYEEIQHAGRLIFPLEQRCIEPDRRYYHSQEYSGFRANRSQCPQRHRYENARIGSLAHRWRHSSRKAGPWHPQWQYHGKSPQSFPDDDPGADYSNLRR